ncbi:MAG: hypothetical protein AAGF30_00290 [Pseudomonadota bacterium]
MTGALMALAFAAGVVIGVLPGYWLGRRAGRREARSQAKAEGLRDAVEIHDRVADSRNDPDRLRQFDGSGWRD